MKLTIRKLTSLALSLCMVTAMITTFAIARSSAYLSMYSAGCNPRSGGEIAVWVDVTGTKAKMDRIGADEIYLYESTDGINFHCEKVFTRSEYPNMTVTNANDYYKTAVTYQGTPGYYYYALVFVYAEKDGGSDTKPYETAVVQARS